MATHKAGWRALSECLIIGELSVLPFTVGTNGTRFPLLGVIPQGLSEKQKMQTISSQKIAFVKNKMYEETTFKEI